MGGFTKPVAEFISRGLESAYDKGVTRFGQEAIDSFLSMGHTMKTHPALEAVDSMIKGGIRTRQQVGDQLFKPLFDFEKAVKADRTLPPLVSPKMPLSTIHSSLPAGPAKTAAAQLMLDPLHHSMTIPDIDAKLSAQANTLGREAAVGPNSINLAATLYPLLRGSPTDKTKAEAVLGVISNIFRDTESIRKGVERSGIKADVANYTRSMIKQYYGPAAAKAFEMSEAAEYKTGGPLVKKVEAASHRYAMTYLAPGIFIAHLADFAKLPATVPAKALWDTLMRMGPSNLQQLKVNSGIFFHEMHSIIHHDFMYRAGVISKATKVPELGAMVNKLFHNPGFHNLRKFQIGVFGSAGYNSVQYWAAKALRGDEGAISALRDLKLDPQAIIARGGKVTQPEMEQAIYEFVNNRLFIDNPLLANKFASSSPFFRVATMFQGYINREFKFLSHEAMRMAKANDYMGLTQFAGTLALLFPYTAGPLIESLNLWARTASFEKAKDRWKEDYRRLTFQEGPGAFLSTYAQMLMHIGGMGVFMNYVHAAVNHHLAAALLGPVPGVITGLAEDVATPIYKPSTVTGERNWKPLERDFLHYMTLPILGNWAQEHFIEKTPPRRQRFRARQ